MIWIDAGYFTAGVVLEDAVVIVATPILRYMLGWPAARVITYGVRKGWVCLAS